MGDLGGLRRGSWRGSWRGVDIIVDPLQHIQIAIYDKKNAIYNAFFHCKICICQKKVVPL